MSGRRGGASTTIGRDSPAPSARSRRSSPAWRPAVDGAVGVARLVEGRGEIQAGTARRAGAPPATPWNGQSLFNAGQLGQLRVPRGRGGRRSDLHAAGEVLIVSCPRWPPRLQHALHREKPSRDRRPRARQSCLRRTSSTNRLAAGVVRWPEHGGRLQANFAAQIAGNSQLARWAEKISPGLTVVAQGEESARCHVTSLRSVADRLGVVVEQRIEHGRIPPRPPEVVPSGDGDGLHLRLRHPRKGQRGYWRAPSGGRAGTGRTRRRSPPPNAAARSGPSRRARKKIRRIRGMLAKPASRGKDRFRMRARRSKAVWFRGEVRP